MKLKIFSCLLLCAFFATAATAQSMKKWTWSSYKMAFQAPSNFKVDQNDAKTFDAGNGKIHMTIYPEKGEAISKSAMKNSLKTWAKDNKLKFSGDVENMEDLNGYWGVFIDGTANDLPTSILLLVDPDYPEISFYVWLQYDEDQLDTAVEILRSFIPS